jgi:hypothetical protein
MGKTPPPLLAKSCGLENPISYNGKREGAFFFTIPHGENLQDLYHHLWTGIRDFIFPKHR